MNKIFAVLVVFVLISVLFVSGCVQTGTITNEEDVGKAVEDVSNELEEVMSDLEEIDTGLSGG